MRTSLVREFHPVNAGRTACFSGFAVMSSDSASIESQFNINAANSNGDGVYEFEGFRLDARRLMLYLDGQEVDLTPKVVETLLALVENAGRIVSKEELFERLWKGSFVDESNLTQNIYLLRKTLGDLPDGKPFIETFRRRGYRFNGEFASSSQVQARNTASGAQVTNLYARAIVLTAAAILAVGGIAVIFYYSYNRRESGVRVTSARVNPTFVPVTPQSYTYSPSLAPDGRSIAYCRLEDDGQNTLEVKDLSSGKIAQLIPPAPKVCNHLQFSSDGANIFFVDQRSRNILSVIPTAGGASRELIVGVTGPYSLSPDDTHAAFITGRSLVVADLNGGSEQSLGERDGISRWYTSLTARPCWSPDGRKILTAGGYLDRGERVAELISIDMSTGDEERVPVPRWSAITSVAWAGDGSGIFVTAREGLTSPAQTWRLSYPTGTPTRLTNDLESYSALAYSSGAKSLAAAKHVGATNVWIGDLNEPGNIRQLTFDDGEQTGRSGLALASDDRVLYSAEYSGNLDIWSVDTAGRDLKQLTSNAGDRNLRQQVTGDGKFIVFASSGAGSKRTIWRMDADGGNRIQLTAGGQDYPTSSPDGKWVYFAEIPGRPSIRKVPIDGGEPVQVTGDYAATLPAISPDGSMMAFVHGVVDTPESGHIAVLKLDGSAPPKVFDATAFRGILHWSPDGKSILYLTKGSPNLWKLPIDGGEATQVTNFGVETIWNFALTAANNKIAISRGNARTEIVLISNF